MADGSRWEYWNFLKFQLCSAFSQTHAHDLKHSYLKNDASGHYLELSHAVYKLELNEQ